VSGKLGIWKTFSNFYGILMPKKIQFWDRLLKIGYINLQFAAAIYKT